MPVPFGINLNSDPQAVLGRPANAAELSGVEYVRFVFFLHDTVVGGANPFGYDLAKPLDYADALQRAFAYYDPLIASYPRVLLILNHQGFAGNAPWFPGSDGNWDSFATDFAKFCGQVAKHYKGKNVAYEIWNEGDQAPVPGEDPAKRASVFVPADLFAPILDRTVREIRNHDQTSPIVLGGLVSGATGAIQYIKQIQNTLHKPLPIKDIGFHPYGAFPGQQAPAIPVRWFGRLAEDGLDLLKQAFPDFCFWITEVGVAEDNPLPQENWPAIAAYMREVYDLVQHRYSSVVKAVIWFAWSDKMRNAGIIDDNGTRKQPIYNQFFNIATMPEAPAPPPRIEVVGNPLFVTPTGNGLNVRPDPSTANPPSHRSIPATSYWCLRIDWRRWRNLGRWRSGSISARRAA